ncbi:MAG: TIGR00159 family protein [Thermomicrobiales bacterium]|nr:TIGR00159 family protein [Thermomicrobiales bacterium]
MPEVTWLLSKLTNPRSIIDILVVAIIIYWVLWVAQGTRATQLLRGAIILLAFAYILASTFSLTTLNWVLQRLWPALFIAIPVIFQPEIRRALEQLGHTGAWLRTIPATDVAIQERMVDEVVRASAQLARLRFGALMVIERETGLQDYADRGVQIDGFLTRQLLINIFYPNSPLHDAAVLIRGDRIVAASVVLPLTDNVSAEGQLGTRHRAGIGVTEDSDALAVIVSEETGQISVAHNGRLIRNLDQDRLRRVLRSLLRIDQRESSGTTSPNGRTPLTKRAANVVGGERLKRSGTRTGPSV